MEKSIVLFSMAVGLSGSAFAAQPCVDGMVAGFPCEGVELVAHLDETALGTTSVSDNWGWADPMTGIEYAIVVGFEGTFFIELSDPEAPVVLGLMPTDSGSTRTRDVKVFDNHAFVVADTGGHGMQVFDLTRLRNVPSPPDTFTPDHVYSGIQHAHNLVLNEATGLAAPVRDDSCSGGLHLLDVSDPLAPTFEGCFGAGVHDAQCFLYAGPDTEHQGQEICIAGTGFGSQVVIGDVSDRAVPVTLATLTYPGADHAHQGWVTDDHRYYLLDDEFDESSSGVNTTTHVFDITDLDDPQYVGAHVAETQATDHNLYIAGNYVYQANYQAGLRVLEMTDLSTATLTEVAYLDTRPGQDSPGIGGAWSVFPYFDSGNVVVTDTSTGFFLVRPSLPIFADGFESGNLDAWSQHIP